MTAEPRAVSAELDATDQAALVRSGEVSPVDPVGDDVG